MPPRADTHTAAATITAPSHQFKPMKDAWDTTALRNSNVAMERGGKKDKGGNHSVLVPGVGTLRIIQYHAAQLIDLDVRQTADVSWSRLDQARADGKKKKGVWVVAKVCVCVCVRACVHACVRACVRACMYLVAAIVAVATVVVLRQGCSSRVPSLQPHTHTHDPQNGGGPTSASTPFVLLLSLVKLAYWLWTMTVAVPSGHPFR